MAFFRQSLVPFSFAVSLLAPALALADPVTPSATDGATTPSTTTTVDTVPGSFPAHSFFDVFVEIQIPITNPPPPVVEGSEFVIPSGQTPEDVDVTDTSGGPIDIIGVEYIISPTSLPLDLLNPPPPGDQGFLPLDITLGNGASADIPVPEPSTLALLGPVLLAAGWCGRRRGGN
jgi:hypothetical protein